ncbi:MAG: peptidase M16 [Chloroflexi bacterium]|nr:peptidase M16 [Chloroflexota bacterium]
MAMGNLNMHTTTILDNKLRVVSSYMPHTSSVTMMILIGAGSRYENAETAGLSHFLEHLPFKGTRSWPSARLISEAVEGAGGIMNATTDREWTIFWFKVSILHFRQAFSVLMDMILHPNLDPDEMEKERAVIQDELRMANDYPTQRVDLLIDELLWPNQAMGRDPGGTLDSVANISIDAVKEYMTTQYNPANTVISLAGNIAHEEVTELIDLATQEWTPRTSLPWENVKTEPRRSEAKVEYRRTDQSNIRIGLPGVSWNDADRYPLLLLNWIFGGGVSSRLFLNLREDLGLAYDVSSSVDNFRDCGSLVVCCGVAPRKIRAAVEAIMEQFSLITRGITKSELTRAKEFTKNTNLLRMENSSSVATWLCTHEFLFGKVPTMEEVIQSIDAVTEDDIDRVSRRILIQDNLKTAIVGPHKSDKGILELLQF